MDSKERLRRRAFIAAERIRNGSYTVGDIVHLLEELGRAVHPGYEWPIGVNNEQVSTTRLNRS